MRWVEDCKGKRALRVAVPTQYQICFFLSAEASLTRLSRICVGVQAAKPNTNAGLSFASMQKNDSAVGLTAISKVRRRIIENSSSRFSQATTFNPASGICKAK